MLSAAGSLSAVDGVSIDSATFNLTSLPIAASMLTKASRLNFDSLQLNRSDTLGWVSSSRDPLKIEVKFSAPLGYRAANLVVTADDAIRLILHAHHVGMIEDSLAQEELHAVGRSVRGAFETAIRYQDFEVSYQALKERANSAPGDRDDGGSSSRDTLREKTPSSGAENALNDEKAGNAKSLLVGKGRQRIQS